MDPPRVSVVIPTHQRRDSVARAIRALARQTVDAREYEVIVVIDGSTDGTRELVSSMETGFAIHTISKPRGGRASACNAGLRLASAPIVVFLDDDMEAQAGFLAAHLDAHARDSRVGVVGAVPIPVSESSTPVARYVASRFNGHLGNLAAPGHAFGVRDFYSGNFSVEREAMVRIGGFDESFTEYGNEDIDLSLRLRAAGVTLVFRADAVAHQHYEKDFAALARDNEDKGRTAVQLATKHPEVVNDLRLSQFHRGAYLPRLARNALLAATRRWSGTRDLVIRSMSRLSDSNVPGLRHAYPIVLDYLYWLGVRSARGEQDAAAKPAPAPALTR
jgi:GT2 family glycosyltransferase